MSDLKTLPTRGLIDRQFVEPSALRKIWTDLREYRWLLAILLLMSIFEAVLGGLSLSLLIPVTQALTNVSGANASSFDLFPDWLTDNASLGIFMLGASFATRAIFSALRAWLSIHVAEDLRQRLQQHMVGHIVGLDLQSLNETQDGVLIENALHVTDKAAMFVLKFFNYMSQVMLLLGLIGLLVIVHWISIVILFCLAGAIWLSVGRRYFVWSKDLGTKKIFLAQKITGTLSAALSSAKEIKINDNEVFWTRKINRSIGELRSYRVTSKLAAALPMFLAQFLIGLLIIGFATIGFVSNFEWADMLPIVIFFSTTFYRLFHQTMQVSVSRFSMLNLHYAFELISLEKPKGGSLGGTNRKFSKVPNSPVIELQHVSFSYPPSLENKNSGTVLNDISFVVSPGEIHGIFGPSGSGKTTIIDIVAGLYQPTSGSVKAFGQDLTGINLQQWRSCIGYVQQDPVLFNETIRENIRIGREEITDEAIISALTAAMIPELVSLDGDGLDTVIQEGGANLSGGQIRRLAIARAIVTKPDLVILDETGSSFEETMERQIIENLSKEIGAAIIVVSHRTSTHEWIDHSMRLGSLTSD